ncbi:flagellar filament capping protein FliD [Clostridium beijerinckii]|uniref:flagellar filament capping protein FliD n=1 Tax=Clostridium beijerinckii TaxID=1520 RepID=UPI0006867472|nr:flagellar filament capping protein FliD [Clostridium beijerinckii]
MTSIMQGSSTSSNSSTSSANLLRISGMASGIDTDSVVKSMVSNYQSKIDKANQAKQTLQWKQDAYRDIIKSVKKLQDYFDPISSKYILGGSSMNINTATSDNTAVASATAASTATAGTYVVTTNKLAEQAKVTGTSLDSMITVGNATSNGSTWSKATLVFGTDSTDTFQVKDGITSMSDLVADINTKLASSKTAGGKVSASYVNDGTNSYIKFTSTDSTIGVKATTYDGTTPLGSPITKINSGISSSTKLSDLGIGTAGFKLSYDSTTTGTPVPITATGSDTVQSLMDKVKSATSGAVTMSIDDATGKISFQSKGYGSASMISISSVSGDIAKLGISANSDQGADANVTITAPGQSAVTTTQTSNQFTINGVSYNLSNVGTANVTIAANTDNIVNNIKSFITDYNAIISTINTKLTEKKDSAYPPLTDAQKESMSESQITAWETKAKVGVLKNDDYLNDVMTQLKGIFSSPVYNSYNGDSTTGKVPLSLGKYGSNAIGIDTSSDYTDGGKIVITDAAKLASTIQNHFDDFKKMFSGTSSTSLDSLPANTPYIGSKTYMEDGLFTRMNTILSSYVATPGLGTDGTYTLSGSMNIFVNKQYDYSTSGASSKNTLPDQVYQRTLSISKLKTQMSDAETRYYAKFTALETAMSKLNAQQSQLSSMLGTA